MADAMNLDGVLDTDRVFDYIQASKSAPLQRILQKMKDSTLLTVQSNPPQLHGRIEYRDEAIEKVKFAANVTKINKDEKQQTRALVVTDRAIYNFKPGKLSAYKRRIPLICLRGAILSKRSDEIVFQVRNDYDYRYIIPHRQDVLKVTANCFQSQTGSVLSVYMAPDENLRSYVMTRGEWNTAPSILKLMKSQKLSLSEPVSPSRQHVSKVEATSTAQRVARTIHSSVLRSMGLTSCHLAQQLGRMSGGDKERSPPMEGWLSVLDYRTRKWKISYVALHQRTLSIFEPRIKGTLTTDTCRVRYENEYASQSSIGHRRSTSDMPLAFTRWSSNQSDAPPPYVIMIRSPCRSKDVCIGSCDKRDIDEWCARFQYDDDDVVAGASSAMTIRTKEGWLLKRDPRSKRWRRRYFVLKNGRCWWYEMVYRAEIVCRKHVEVSAFTMPIETTIDINDQTCVQLTGDADFKYRFNISEGDKAWSFAADTENDRHAWIRTIQAMGWRHARTHSVDAVGNVTEEFIDGVNQIAPTGDITFVFSDIQGSTVLWENAPEAMNEALEIHDDTLRKLLNEFNGYEVKTEGDAFMVTFHNAIDAVRWCCQVQASLMQAKWPVDLLKLKDGKREVIGGKIIFNGVRIRMGVHTGHANLRRNPVTKRMDYYGPDVNLAARVSDCAHGGQIITTITVHERLRALFDDDPVAHVPDIVEISGPYQLKGIKRPQRIFQIIDSRLCSRTFPPLRAPIAQLMEEHQHEQEDDELSHLSEDSTGSVFQARRITAQRARQHVAGNRSIIEEDGDASRNNSIQNDVEIVDDDNYNKKSCGTHDEEKVTPFKVMLHQDTPMHLEDAQTMKQTSSDVSAIR